MAKIPRNPPAPSGRSFGLVTGGLYGDLIATEQPDTFAALIPPKEIKLLRQQTWNTIKDRPMKDLIRLNPAPHPEIDRCFEAMVAASGRTPAGDLSLDDAVTLLKGLIHNITTTPSGYEEEYILLMRPIVSHVLEKTECSNPILRKINPDLTVVEEAANTNMSALFAYAVNKPVDVESLRNLAVKLAAITPDEGLKPGSETYGIPNARLEVLRDIRHELEPFTQLLPYAEDFENRYLRLMKTIFDPAKVESHSYKDENENRQTSYTITLLPGSKSLVRPELLDKPLDMFRTTGANIVHRDSVIKITPITDSPLAAALHTYNKINAHSQQR